jgi:hypothetical protein
MTRNDIKQLLTLLQAAYPSAFRDMSDAAVMAMIGLWEALFSQYPVDLVSAALHEYMKTNHYPPSPAGLQEFIDAALGTKDYETMFQELWKGICGDVKFKDMCPENQAFIGSQKALDELGQSEDTIQSVVKGQYLKRIPEIVKARETQASAAKAIGQERLQELQQGTALKQLAEGVFAS